MELMVGIIVFVLCVVFIEALHLAYLNLRSPHRGGIRKRLQAFSREQQQRQQLEILRRNALSDIPWFHRLLARMPRFQRLKRLLEQADVPVTLGFFILVIALFAVSGLLIGSFLDLDFLLSLGLAVLCGTVPLHFLRLRKKQRTEKFERQLAEALELVSRSLKAGHAFMVGLKMVAEEFGEPIGVEFQKVYDEIQFGISAQEALLNLCNRIDLPDLRFFVISVILQRETGGNLAEIIEKIALLTRERFKFKGKVRALAAEGKLSAMVIICLVPFVVFSMLVTNPDYILTLVRDPIGRIIAYSALGMAVAGLIVTRKLVTIKL